jgi:hypothetical protein
MRGAILLLLLALGQPVLPIDDDEGVPTLECTVVLNVKNKSRREVLQEAFAQVGARLEFDYPALLKSGFDLNERVTRDYGELPLRGVMLSLFEYPRIEGIHVVQDGDDWVLTSLSLLKARRDEFSPDWLRAARNAHPMLNHRGEIYELTITGPVDESVFERLQDLPSLRKLSVSGDLSPDIYKHLLNAASLEEVELRSRGPSGIPVGDAAVEALATLPSLKSLHLGETGVTDRGIERLSTFPALRELFIYQESHLTDASLKTIGALQGLKSLSMITYVRNAKEGVATFTAEGYASLSGLHNLEHLTFIHAFNPPSIKVLTLPRLKSIALSGASVDDDTAAHITAMSTLQRVSFEGDILTDEGLRHLSRLPALRVLSFTSQRVTPAGVAALEQLPHLQELRCFTPPTDETLKRVSEIKSLRRLKLTGVPSTRGFAMLSALPALSWLELSGPVDEASLKSLTHLKKLTYLSLSGVDFTQERLDRLRQELPGVHIEAMRPITGGFSPYPSLR